MIDTGTGPHTAGPHDGHLDADAVADLDEGLLGPAEAALAQAHLATCAACAGMLRDLQELRLLLRAQVDVPPVPADIVARVDEALARAQAEEDAAADHPDPVVVRLRPRRSGRARQLVLAVAAVAAAGFVAVPLLDGVLSGGDDSVGGRSASDSSGAGQAPAEGSAPYVEPGPGRVTVGRSGTVYTAATLAGAAGRLLADDAASSSGPARVPPAEGAVLERLRDPAALSSCLSGLRTVDASLGAEPLAVDLATFDGRPAAVLVLARAAAVGEQDTVVAVAVGPGCDAQAPDVLAEAVVRP